MGLLQEGRRGRVGGVSIPEGWEWIGGISNGESEGDGCVLLTTVLGVAQHVEEIRSRSSRVKHAVLDMRRGSREKEQQVARLVEAMGHIEWTSRIPRQKLKSDMVRQITRERPERWNYKSSISINFNTGSFLRGEKISQMCFFPGIQSFSLEESDLCLPGAEGTTNASRRIFLPPVLLEVHPFDILKTDKDIDRDYPYRGYLLQRAGMTYGVRAVDYGRKYLPNIEAKYYQVFVLSRDSAKELGVSRHIDDGDWVERSLEAAVALGK